MSTKNKWSFQDKVIGVLKEMDARGDFIFIKNGSYRLIATTTNYS